jgi:hypothetical protein
MSNEVEPSETGVWSVAGFRKKRGSLTDEARRFRLDISLDKSILFDNSTIKTPTRASGISDESHYYYLLKDCYRGGYQTHHGRTLVRSRLSIIAYTKLKSKSPIKKLSFKSVEFDIPVNLSVEANLMNLLIHDSLTEHERRPRTLTIFKNNRVEAILTAIVSNSGSSSKVVMQTRSFVKLLYRKPASLKTIIKDIDLLRTVFAICSQFEVAVNINDVRLYYDEKETHRDYEYVTLSSKNRRELQKYEDKNNLGNMSLFNTFLSNPSEMMNKYVSLLKNKDFQHVINSYLSHYIPSRRNGYTIELQFMLGIQLLEALYERVVESSDDEVKRKKKSFRCKCGNEFCSQCTKLELRNLEAKIRKLQQIAFSNTSKYRAMTLPYGNISKTRNYYTHGKTNNSNILNTHELDVVTCKMEFIFLAVLYKELGYAEESLENFLPMIKPFSGFNQELME